MLILFYAKIVYQHRWHEKRMYFVGTCLAVNVTMVILTCLYASFIDISIQRDDSEEAYDGEVIHIVYDIASSIFFGALVAPAIFYLRKVFAMNQSQPGISRQEIIIAFLVFVIFLSRCIVDLLAAFDIPIFIHYISEIKGEDGQRVKLLATSSFFLIFIWEIVPTLMVIVFFRKMPASRGGVWAKIKAKFFENCNCCQNCFAKAPPQHLSVNDEGFGDNYSDVLEEDFAQPQPTNSYSLQQSTEADAPRHSDSKQDPSDPLFEDNLRYDSDGWRKNEKQEQNKQPLFNSESPI